ncbi:MAG: CopY family transcriptional regulator [Planctomycetes bacterium]|nr:CopY family transcriptional regulator [Planctomycetota bacterium]
MTRKTRVLTNLELAVMNVVWGAGPEPMTVRDVAERLNAGSERPLAYTTVQTMMRILKEKGVLRSRPGPGRAHAFTTRLSRDDMTSTMVGDLVDRLFDGRAQPLLARLIDHDSVTRDELQRLKHLIQTQLDDEEDVR